MIPGTLPHGIPLRRQIPHQSRVAILVVRVGVVLDAAKIVKTREKADQSRIPLLLPSFSHVLSSNRRTRASPAEFVK